MNSLAQGHQVGKLTSRRGGFIGTGDSIGVIWELYRDNIESI